MPVRETVVEVEVGLCTASLHTRNFSNFDCLVELLQLAVVVQTFLHGNSSFGPSYSDRFLRQATIPFPLLPSLFSSLSNQLLLQFCDIVYIAIQKVIKTKLLMRMAAGSFRSCFTPSSQSAERKACRGNAGLQLWWWRYWNR